MYSSVNIVTGKVEWIPESEHSSTQLIANSDHVDMVCDSERNRRYHKAIARMVQKKKEKGENVHVLDIGTGSGLLAMIAAAHGATVTACEQFEPLAGLAKEITSHLPITVLPVRSNELTVKTCPPVDIIVTEIFDSELLGEGILPSLLDAKRLCKDDSVVIPATAKVWAQLFYCEDLEKCGVIPTIPLKLCTKKELFLLNPEEICKGFASTLSLQLSRCRNFTLVSDPFEIFDFNFQNVSESDNFRNLVYNIPIIKDLPCHGVCFWWDLCMDSTDSTNVLSTNPFNSIETNHIYTSDTNWIRTCNGISDLDCPFLDEKIPNNSDSKTILRTWRDHWVQNVRLLPISTKEKSSISLSCSHDEYSIWFTEHCKLAKNEEESHESPFCTCGLHLSLPRILQFHDEERWSAFELAIKSLYESVSSEDFSILQISDGSILAMLAAFQGRSKIYSIEPNLLAKQASEKRISFNGLSQQITVLRVNEPSLEILAPQIKPKIVLAEPVFSYMEYPWHALSIWYSFHKIKETVTDCKILPCEAKLYGRLINMPNLCHSFSQVSNVEGHDLSSFNQVSNSSVISSYCSWQYEINFLSEAVEILNFDMYADISEQNNSLVIPNTFGNVVHGIILYMDWTLVPGITISTGPNINYSIRGDSPPSADRQAILAIEPTTAKFLSLTCTWKDGDLTISLLPQLS